MENNEDIGYLLARYCNQLSTREEYDRFMQLVAETEHDEKLRTLLNQVYKEMETREQEVVMPFSADIETSEHVIKTLNLWPGIASAVAIAVVILGIWIYSSKISYRHSNVDQEQVITYHNDIAPGKNTATLTYADGKIVSLDTTMTSVVITDSVKTMTMLTASTPRGGTYLVVLPDGTKAWLNAASSIRFPSSFATTKQRRIEMTGEVYFEVTKDNSRPFIVETGRQQIEVLGTHFNINSYSDESTTKTTLLEGSIRVTPGSSGITAKDQSKSRKDEEVTLKPGQQSVLSDFNHIEVKRVDANAVVDWKNGDFMFKTDDFRTLMRKVARWYDVEIVYDESAPVELPLLGEISRSKNISALLNIMEATGDVHFKIEERRVTVKK